MEFRACQQQRYITKFISLIDQHNYDFISGSRFLEGASFKNNPLYRVFLIKIFSLILRIITKKRITDATCGYRAFRVDLFKNFNDSISLSKTCTMTLTMFSFSEPFLEAVPQVIVLLCIGFLRNVGSLVKHSTLGYSTLAAFSKLPRAFQK